MGYGRFTSSHPDKGIEWDRGYDVETKCHKRGCKKIVDRGLGCLCYDCTWYFCGEHLTWAYCNAHDEMIKVECYAGEGGQLCEKCADELEKLPKDECHL